MTYAQTCTPSFFADLVSGIKKIWIRNKVYTYTHGRYLFSQLLPKLISRRQNAWDWLNVNECLRTYVCEINRINQRRFESKRKFVRWSRAAEVWIGAARIDLAHAESRCEESVLLSKCKTRTAVSRSVKAISVMTMTCSTGSSAFHNNSRTWPCGAHAHLESWFLIAF